MALRRGLAAIPMTGRKGALGRRGGAEAPRALKRALRRWGGWVSLGRSGARGRRLAAGRRDGSDFQRPGAVSKERMAARSCRFAMCSRKFASHAAGFVVSLMVHWMTMNCGMCSGSFFSR